MQELRAFLEVEGALADSYQWRQLQPLQGSVLEGIARLPKQLLGTPHDSLSLEHTTIVTPILISNN